MTQYAYSAILYAYVNKGAHNGQTAQTTAKIYDLHELYANDILLLDTINEIDNWNYDVEITTTGYGIRVNRANMLDNTVYTANGMVPPSINDSSGIFRSDTQYKVQTRIVTGKQIGRAHV